MHYKYNVMKDSMDYITKADFERLLNLCVNRRDKLLLITLVYSGRRISEIVRQLRPKDIDFYSEIIVWSILKKNHSKKKDNKPKLPPIRKPKVANPFLLNELKKYIEIENIQPDEYIFPISRVRAWQIISKISIENGVRTAGGRSLHPHCFRHSFSVWVVRLADSKIEDLRALMGMLEHSSIEMTMQYLDFGKSREKELIGKL